MPQPVKCCFRPLSTHVNWNHGALKYRGFSRKILKQGTFLAISCSHFSDHCYIFWGGKPHLQPRSKQAQFVLRSALLASTSVEKSWQVWVSKNGTFAARKNPTAIFQHGKRLSSSSESFNPNQWKYQNTSRDLKHLHRGSVPLPLPHAHNSLLKVHLRQRPG